MDKNKREKKKKKKEDRTFASTKQEGVQSNDFPVPSLRLGVKRRILQKPISKTVGSKELQADFGYPPSLQARVQFQSGVVGDDYQDIEIEAAGGTVLYSHEGQEIDRSLKQSSSTTTTTNEDERENVSLISEESEIVPDVGLIDDLKIGHFEPQSARQDKNEIQPIARFPGNENFSCIEIEEDIIKINTRQMKGKVVVREKQINDVRASLGSNKIEKSCSGAHQIENEISNDDHKAQKRNCGNQKDALEWILMIASFLLELPSAFLDQLASVHKPQYALCGILISVAALLICVVELIFKARKEKVAWKWRGRLLPCFYPRHNQKLFDTFKDNIIGGVVAFCQVIIITINYAFLRQGAGKPIQVCVWPIIFSLGQICSKIL
ncbi:hypothetical protein WN944_019344 [Citrus x changshan-huyou]|uniref:Uncharacterized protein n=1 Tax=Citrus x changshan-huyou TaxID=2935761 RepID=A0AAP0LYF1_9ROSI